MKVLQAIKSKIKEATERAIDKISILRILQYRKGNHDGAIAGIIAGLALLGGALSQTFAGSFNALLGSDASYLADFLGILGFISLIEGFLEYRKIRRNRNN